jgi:hypothetical protein
LRRHIENVHEKLKRYKCDHCEAAFSQSTNLKNHLKRSHDVEWNSQVTSAVDEILIDGDIVTSEHLAPNIDDGMLYDTVYQCAECEFCTMSCNDLLNHSDIHS